MTENTTPDTSSETDRTIEDAELEEFNLDEWLETGATGRATETVTVYRDTSLLEQARKLKAEADRINTQTETEGEDLAVGEAPAASRVQAELDELEAKIRATRAEVVITALSDGEVEDIAATYKQRYPGEKRSWDQTVKGTALALATAATFNGRRLSADQWRKLSDGPLAGGQWTRIKQALLLVQNKGLRVDNPFS